MTRGQFEQTFQGLPKRRREVLERFLAGVKDEEIARILNIKEGTVRSHIRNSCDAFGLENLHEDDYSSRRGDLVELFKQYKPELVKEKVEEEEAIAFDPNFVGREEAIADLNALIQEGAKCIQILSAGGQGKTTLAWQFLKTRFPNKEDIIYFPIGKETKDIASIESLVEEKLRLLGEEPGREFLVSLERLRERLTRQPMGVLIDNLEPALDESNRFVAQHRSYVELFKQVLLSPEVRSVTLITSRAPLQEALAIKKYTLKPLSAEAWNQYFQYRKIVTDATVLQEVHGSYNGNALAMEILCSAIQDKEDYENNLAEYWADNKTEAGIYIEDPVLNLIREQFNSLERLKPDAYKLLCRMGCFRYQDVPTVPEEGLFCLLWDVPKSQHKRVLKVLKNRALVDVVDGEYRLHPVVRSEALERLQSSDDWEKLNRVAAEFWTKSITQIESVRDAIIAFEATHHYQAIGFKDLAFNVIITERNHFLEEGESLGRAFYRLGLLQKSINAINITNNCELQKFQLCRKFNILGDLYWITGKVRDAILLHKKARRIAKNIDFEEYILNSLLNIGICYVYLFELHIAKNYLLKLDSLLQNIDHEKYGLDPWYLLALVNSYLGNTNDSIFFAEKSYKTTKPFSRIGSIWTKSYMLLSLGETYKNIGNIQKSIYFYHEAISYSKITHYTQVKAKALIGIAEISRIQSNFEKALDYHQESIQILEKIGAKCDLAEAHYQLALTYQTMNNPESQTHFNKALELWTEIDAPKQIERVRNSMNNSSR